MMLEESTTRLKKLALITEKLVSDLPDIKSKKDLINWLNKSPYSPYVTLYGGKKSLTYNHKKSFVSNLDRKQRYTLEDKITLNLQNFKNFGNRIFSSNDKLSKIINAEELFKAYPEFKDIQLQINISNSNNNAFSGSTYYENNKASKIEVFASNNSEAMRVLVHELQHCIQLKEGFTIGKSYYNKEGVVDLFVGLKVNQEQDEIVSKLNKDHMFNNDIVFKEIFNDKEYFKNNKQGLKAKLIYIHPLDYIEAVKLEKPEHKETESKLLSLKEAYDKNIKVGVPYLIYGERDEPNSIFGQEGYNRALNAFYCGRDKIPVFVRYREDDEKIPHFIKNSLLYEEGSFSDIATKAIMTEIDDSTARLLIDFNSTYTERGINTYRLADILKHDELFERYPELTEINIKISKNFNANTYGLFHTIDETPTIEVNENIIHDSNLFKRVLLHELQHNIQHIEKWDEGTTVDSIIEEKSQVHYRKKLLSEKRKILSENQKLQNLLAKHQYGYDLNEEEMQTLEELKKESGYSEIQKELIDIDKRGILSRKEAYKIYLSSWGEQQARATEYRLDMSKNERLKESFQETLKREEGKFEEPILNVGKGNKLAEAKILEDSFLNSKGNLDTQNLLKTSSKLPKSVKSFKDFRKLMLDEKTISTPIENIKINPFYSFGHLTRNSKKQNRFRISGAFFETLRNPLFIVKEEHFNEKKGCLEVNNKYFKPFYDNENNLINLANITLDKKGNVGFQKTFFKINDSQLKNMIKCEEDSLLYINHSMLENIALKTEKQKFLKDDISNIITEDSFMQNNPKEKKDAKFIEKTVSIIPNNMSIEDIKKYMIHNEIFFDDIQDLSIKNSFKRGEFINPISVSHRNNNNLDYHNNKGEIESKRVESIYNSKLDNLSIKQVEKTFSLKMLKKCKKSKENITMDKNNFQNKNNFLKSNKENLENKIPNNKAPSIDI